MPQPHSTCVHCKHEIVLTHQDDPWVHVNTELEECGAARPPGSSPLSAPRGGAGTVATPEPGASAALTYDQLDGLLQSWSGHFRFLSDARSAPLDEDVVGQWYPGFYLQDDTLQVIQVHVDGTGTASWQVLDPIAEDVLAECRAEAARSLEQNDVAHWSPADVAADIVRRLDTFYEIGYENSPSPSKPLDSEHLYEKCDGCHFFIEANPAFEDDPVHLARYIHLTRGDNADELMACDEAKPSGRKANLLTWKTYGPLAMRERFTA